ncbi:hypothetical protein C8F01DRAFT_140710 [Mycena amicta]|nr:hypothetical protein C8F01DRAFT_140710 [Mycena amicta]
MKEEPDRDSSSSSGTEAPRSIDDEYRRELEHACVTENLAEMHGLPVAKRRERLRFRERNMLQFSPISAHQVQLPVGDSVLYALGPDLFIEAYTPYGATAPRTRIRAISLLGPNHRAKEIDVGIPILDFLVLIAERDLLVLLTKFGDRDIRLECWTYTSGTLGHTQAKHPSFLLELDLPSNTPSTSIAAVSSALIDNMVAVSFMTKNKKFGLTYYDWQLTFYDWQLGIRLCTPGRIGALGTAFVSPQHLLTTSLDMSCLEVLRVPGPRGDNPPVHLDHLVKVSFQLPPLCPGHEIQRCSMQMNGQEPSSSPLACPPHSPFLPRPADALILVLMDIGPNENDATKHCLIIRRAPFLHYVKTLQHLKQNRFVPWKDWGPKCARWIDTQHSSGCSISSLMGQHMVILDKHADDKKDTTVSLCILDFNESIVRQQRDRGTEVESSPTARIWLEESDAAFCMKSEPEPESPSSDAPATSRRRSTRLQHTSQPSYRAANVPFAVPISSEISYVATFSKKKYKFNDVLMTEDSVVGVQWQAKSQDRNIPSPGSLEVFRLS